MRKSTLTLSIALVVSTAVAGWLWRELAAERMRSAGLIARLDSRAVTETPAASRTTPDTRPLAAATHIGAPQAQTLQAAASDGREDFLARQQRLLRDPKYLDAYRATRKAQLSRWRQDAIRLLGFTPKDADAVIDLFVERQIAGMTAPTPVVDVTPEGMQRLKDQNEADERAYQDGIRARVGEGKRVRWQDFLESMGSRRQVQMLSAELPDTDALRDDQVEPLIAALHDESKQYRRELGELSDTLFSEPQTPEQQRRYFDRKMELMKANQHRQHVAASGILTSTQLRLLDEALQREIENEQAGQREALIADKLDRAVPGEKSGD